MIKRLRVDSRTFHPLLTLARDHLADVVQTLGRIRRVGWRREQVLDIAFNVTIALVGFATVGLVWYFVDASGLSALGGGSMAVVGAQISGVARSVAPSVPGYLAAAALMGGVLLAWWWAER